MAEFPPPGVKEDSDDYGIEWADNIHRVGTEGGYELRRPRTTRRPSRMFKTRFTELTTAQKELVDDFFVRTKYGIDEFTYDLPWTNPKEEINVQFENRPAWTYKGIKNYQVWTSNEIILKELP